MIKETLKRTHFSLAEVEVFCMYSTEFRGIRIRFSKRVLGIEVASAEICHDFGKNASVLDNNGEEYLVGAASPNGGRSPFDGLSLRERKSVKIEFISVDVEMDMIVVVFNDYNTCTYSIPKNFYRSL